METLETYKTGDKVLIKVKSEITCVGCYFHDKETEACMRPDDLPSCMKGAALGRNYQYHEQIIIAE